VESATSQVLLQRPKQMKPDGARSGLQGGWSRSSQTNDCNNLQELQLLNMPHTCIALRMSDIACDALWFGVFTFVFQYVTRPSSQFKSIYRTLRAVLDPVPHGKHKALTSCSCRYYRFPASNTGWAISRFTEIFEI
jgi:hypothetical protein